MKRWRARANGCRPGRGAPHQLLNGAIRGGKPSGRRTIGRAAHFCLPVSQVKAGSGVVVPWSRYSRFQPWRVPHAWGPVVSGKVPWVPKSPGAAPGRSVSVGRPEFRALKGFGHGGRAQRVRSGNSRPRTERFRMRSLEPGPVSGPAGLGRIARMAEEGLKTDVMEGAARPGGLACCKICLGGRLRFAFDEGGRVSRATILSSGPQRQ